MNKILNLFLFFLFLSSPVYAQVLPTDILQAGYGIYSCESNGIADPAAGNIALAIRDLRGTESVFSDPANLMVETDSSPNFPQTTQFLSSDFEGNQVFATAFDTRNGRIYVGTGVYGSFGFGGSAIIYTISPDGSNIDRLATLPGDLNLGWIEIDERNDRIFASNLDDGLIYSIDINAGLNQTTGFTTYAPHAADPLDGSLPDRGETIAGIGYNQLENRLYYAVWGQDSDKFLDNTIRSVAITAGGGFDASSDRLEITQVNQDLWVNGFEVDDSSMPVFDIDFNRAGTRMLLAEQTLSHQDSTTGIDGDAHASRILDFSGQSGAWTPSVDSSGQNVVHHLGFVFGFTAENGATFDNNTRGGVSFMPANFDDTTGFATGIDEFLIATGDALPFGNQAFPTTDIYGLQYHPISGGDINSSVRISLTDNDNQVRKGFYGDIDVREALGPVRIGNFVWLDTNRDGIQDPLEPGIEGVSVRLFDSAGNLLDTAITDENGEYFFDVPDSSDFSLKLDNPNDSLPGGALSELLLTIQDAGSVDSVDSDAADMGGFAAIMLTSPEIGEDLSFDFGFVEPVRIGDFVFLDSNADGVQDAGDIPIEGVTVSLFDTVTGAFISSTETDVNGEYFFNVAPNTDFTVKLDNPLDYAVDGPLNDLSLTLLNAGTDDALDSDAINMGGFAAIMLTSPATGEDLSFDFGFAEAPTFPGVANGPTYFFWNTNLGIQNIASNLNGGGTFFDSLFTTFRNDGSFVAENGSWLFPDGSFDVILPGLPSESYGIGRIDLIPTTSAETYDGLIAQYRFAPDGNEIEFAKFSPLTQATSGSKFLIYNTFQPSGNPSEFNNQVTTFAEVANPDMTTPKGFTVNIYDTAGNLASTESFVVPPLGRFDVQAGHVVPGPSNQGLVEVIPTDPNAPFITQISRYGADSPAGVFPSSFSFATTSVGSDGFLSEIVAPVSSGGGAMNWVVVTNTAAAPTTALVEFLDYSQNVVQSSTVAIPAKGQITVNADSLFPGGTSGIVKVTPLGTEAIIADSMFYFLKPDGSISTAYVSHGEPNYSAPKYGTYNTYLGQQNWLKLFNDSSSPATVTITVNQLGGASPAVPLGSTSITLQPGAGVDAELIGTLGFAIPADTYGTVEVTAPAGVFSQLLRLRWLNGFIDLAKAVPVR